MKKLVFLLFILITPQVIVAQNLVPNPSFETYINCPQGPSTFGTDVPPWSTPDTATPDYYNVCAVPIPMVPSMDVPSNIQGYQNARTGFGYAGIISADNTIPAFPDDWREYLQVQLTSPLVAGTQYCIEFYWSLADVSPYYVEEIGVYLSNTQINLLQSNALPFTPQVEQTGTPLNDTTNWVAFQQNYTAVGGESFITIGNFHNPSSTTTGSTGTACNIAAGGCFAYYYIDDVSVEAGSCCFSSVTPVAPQCETNPPVTLIPTASGGIWSSVPVTAGLNTSTGVFDPSVAGIGAYDIIYTLSCGADTITIQVINCSALSVCVETNGDLTVTGGNGPYTWNEWVPAASTPITTSAQCTACGGTWTLGSCFNPFPIPLDSCNTPAGWSNFGSGITITPPVGADTVQVTDGFGNNLIIYNIGTLPPCSGCDATITQAGPFCTNTAASNLTAAQTGGTWTGTGITNSTNGTFNPATAGTGSFVITYTLPACSDTMTIVVNPLPNTGTNGAISLCTTDPSTDLFNQLGGSPNVGGTWSPALTSGTGMFDPTVDPAGTYTYSITNSCGTSSSDVVVTISSNPSPGTNGTLTICANATSTDLFNQLGGIPSAGGTWSPAMASGTGVFNPAVDAAGTYTYSINDCSGNPLTATVIVTVNPLPTTGTNGAISLCTTDPSTDLFNQLGGSPNVGGIWSPAMASGTGVFNPAVDAAGTYTYTVTNSCGTSSSDVIVTITSCTLPTAGYTVSDSIICEGDCINFTNTSSGATSWLWTFNGGSPSTSTSASPSNICFNSAGNFIIEQIVTNSNGSDTSTSTVVVNATPIIDAGPDLTIELGQSTTLTATGTNGVYTWSPFTWLDCAICVSPISTPEETITYTVIVVDSNGCSATDQVTVIVEFDNVIFVPNIFSPNGDDFNDILYVRGQGVAELNFFIYDRWGEKVFETTTLDKGWDGTFRGKKMNNAVFVYYLQVTFIDGSEVTQKGDITLVR